MSFSIRPIQPKDYKLLAEFLYNAIFLPPDAPTLSRDIIYKPEIALYINNFGGSYDCGSVDEQDGIAVGMAWTRIIPAYGHVDSQTPELAMSVLPAYREHGIGTLLLTSLFELLCRRGYRQTSLSVQKANPAVRLYQRLGYEIIRENHDDFIMVKQLGVRLREWEKEDSPDLALTINNKKVQDNLRDGIPYPYTEKDADDFIHKTLTAEKDTQYAFAITYNGKVIGSIGVFRKDNVHRLTAELGYYVAEAYWGKGVMTNAVKQICAFVFEYTDILRIFASPLVTNHASCRVLEKAGFAFEGCLRQNVIKNGQVLDMKLYSILKTPVIRGLNTDDIAPAMNLVLRVFCEFEAQGCSDEGIAEFKSFINPNSITSKVAHGELRLWGAFENGKPIGVIAIKTPLHIALLFVDKTCQRRGIAKKLLETVTSDADIVCRHNRITVNSSPYAIEIYRRMGFTPTSTEQTMNGLRFTPMEHLLQ